MLRGEAMQDMCPFYKGFKGSITPNEKEPGKYDVCGTIEKKDSTTLSITELPIRQWTQAYKEFLEGLMPGEGKKDGDDSQSTITDFREFHTENSAHFEVTMSADQMKRAEQAGLEKVFKLKTTISTSNMVLFDDEGKIAKYNTAVDILKDWCKLRKKVYVERKGFLVRKITREKEILSNKARFILMVVEGELEIRKKKKADLLKELQEGLQDNE
jgi:DNA topoisomerase-2